MPRRKIDYQRKDLRNPFFRKKKSSNIKEWGIGVVIIIILVIGLRYLVNSSKFLIENIEIRGNKTISQHEILSLAREQLEKHKFFMLPQNNIFLFDTNRLKQEILDKYILEDIKVTKRYFKTIIIEIDETITSVVYLTPNQGYYLDLQGQVISEIKTLTDKQEESQITEVLRNQAIERNLPIINSNQNIDVRIGDRVVEPDIIDFIIELNKSIAQTDITIAYFQINTENKKEVWAKTLIGYLIYFSRDLDIESQVQNLVTLLEEKIEKPQELEYIDLRFGKKVFYK